MVVILEVLPVDVAVRTLGKEGHIESPVLSRHRLAANERQWTVVPVPDETFILETLPLRAGWTRAGAQAAVPITGIHARRVIYGALDIATGYVELRITEAWTAAPHQTLLRAELDLEVHWLPTATPRAERV